MKIDYILCKMIKDVTYASLKLNKLNTEYIKKKN